MASIFPNDDNTAAAQAARLLFINPETNSDYDPDWASPLMGITIRVPASYVARLQVLARSGNVSRNAMAQLVMKAGFDSIFSLLPNEFAENLMVGVVNEIKA